MAEGIRKRHSKGCSAREGGRCNCDGGWEASVYSPRDGRKLYRPSPKVGSEIVASRCEALAGPGALRASNGKTLQEAADAWLRAAERGDIRNRSGRPYKPSTLRGYRRALGERVLPVLGSRRLNAVTTLDLQMLVDEWLAEGQTPATIRNSLKPLQAIYRRARSREGVPINPTHDLELPTPDPGEIRDRLARSGGEADRGRSSR